MAKKKLQPVAPNFVDVGDSSEDGGNSDTSTRARAWSCRRKGKNCCKSVCLCLYMLVILMGLSAALTVYTYTIAGAQTSSAIREFETFMNRTMNAILLCEAYLNRTIFPINQCEAYLGQISLSPVIPQEPPGLRNSMIHTGVIYFILITTASFILCAGQLVCWESSNPRIVLCARREKQRLDEKDSDIHLLSVAGQEDKETPVVKQYAPVVDEA